MCNTLQATKRGRGPNRSNAFDDQPNTSNAVYGFEVMKVVQLNRAREAARALACCRRQPTPQDLPCEQRRRKTIVGVNPRVDFFIAPKVPHYRDYSLIPAPNQRFVYVGDRCHSVKPRLVECKERALTGTMTGRNPRVDFFVAPRLSSTRSAPWIQRCSCE
ncbi:unnamed protein product [Mesocestoides corti]|uniref:Uncharacterized protein n=2 Tax=Mesocestoides corti TaxID=53468 RepID=A0A0R3UIU9_MESCO|nr:unnamed protein product [Mesocestoides corti]